MPVLGQVLISTQSYFYTQPVALAANGLDGGFLHARNTLGGTAPTQVRAQLERHRAGLLSIS